MTRGNLSEADLLVLERNMAPRVSGGVDRKRAVPTFDPFQLALTGQLPSGKNQVQLLFRNGKVCKYPNKTFTNWRLRSCMQILEQTPFSKNETVNLRDMQSRIDVPVRLTVDYWPGDQRTRDVSGQCDALFHLLVYAKVLKDDGLIYDVTWRRRDLKNRFPKVVMEIERWHTPAPGRDGR